MNKVTGKNIFGHAMGGVGQNLIFGLWSGYMMIFYTDVFGISAGIVGIIFLVSRIWDGINDPLMGIIADNTKSKWGRFRPWLIYMPIPIGICLVLNFTVPGFSESGKIVYAFITYIIMSMAFTAVDVPYWSLPSAMTGDADRRTQIFSVSRLSTTVTSILAGVIVVPLINAIGQGDMQKGYQGVAIVFAVVAAGFYLISFFLVKENVEASTEKFEFKKAVKAFSTNKPLLILIISSLISFIILSMRMGLQIYYVQYNLGSLDLVPLVSVASLPGIVLGALLAPVLSKRFGKKNVMIVGNALTVIFGAVFYFVGYSDLTMVVTLIAILSFPLGLNMVLLSSMTADTIEYAEWKTGQNNAGLISSTQTLITKIGMAISGAVIGIILEATNYIPNVEQTAETLNAIHFSMSMLPAIASVFAIIPLFAYDLTAEKHAQIVKELEERKAKK